MKLIISKKNVVGNIHLTSGITVVINFSYSLIPVISELSRIKLKLMSEKNPPNTIKHKPVNKPY